MMQDDREENDVMTSKEIDFVIYSAMEAVFHSKDVKHAYEKLRNMLIEKQAESYEEKQKSET